MIEAFNGLAGTGHRVSWWSDSAFVGAALKDKCAAYGSVRRRVAFAGRVP